MKKSLALVLSAVTAGALGFSLSATAETVAVPVGKQGNANVDTPARGLFKPQVEQRYGAPNKKISSVGEPPISRWEYSNFTVYFDTDYVIHSVRHPSK